MITVLSSFPAPRPTTNPYIAQLARVLQENGEVELCTFSWRRTLTRRFDVFHAHWPENLVGGRPGPKKAVRQLLFILAMLRFRLQGTAIVRTVHNLHLPTGLSPIERVLLLWFDRRTDHRVIINPVTPLPDGQPHTIIRHGHYSDWYSGMPKFAPVPGRLAFVGLIRRYKGTESLVKAFCALSDPLLSLTVAGKPSNPELAAKLTAVAENDPRVQFRFEFLNDAELVAATTQAELIVLPYQHMHNSGGALTALSLDRPVLVPDNDVNQQLALEVGPGWVQVFTGELDGSDLRRALEGIRAARLPRIGARPDLSAREWTGVGDLHVVAYRRAMEGARKHAMATRGSGLIKGTP